MSDDKNAGKDAAKEAAKAVNVTDTPEFKAMVAAAVAAALPQAVSAAVTASQTELLAKLSQAPAAAVGTPGLSPAELFSQMALAIAEISDQGTSRKRVAPEILAQRAKAHERAVARLMLAREKGEKPEYRVTSKIYLNERLIEPFMPGPDKQPIPTEIVWCGMPSQGMKPINAVAREIFEPYRESLGSIENIKGADNRPYWMTPGGVVIKGDARNQRREVKADPAFADDLGIKNQNDPTAPFIHVLGTIAAPARQNVTNQLPV